MPDSYSYRQHLKNSAQNNSAFAAAKDLFTLDECTKAQSIISSWPGYKPTPLVHVSDLAEQAAISELLYKDESSRFGLGSFKALGGSYAIQQLAAQREQNNDQPLVVSTATDGNHGRSVAWGAQSLGVECHIFLHAHVSQNRANSMAKLGAIIHWVEGNYDDSVAACIELSNQHSWQIISDTSWEGYREIPRQIMIGYTMMAEEIIQQLSGEIPTHVFLPAGCGGLAGAMIAYFWQHWRESLPNIIIIESEKSDCVYQSLKNNKILLVDIVEETVMAGLSCGEVSELAWPLLQLGVRHVVTLNDDGVEPIMRQLAAPGIDAHSERPSIEAGECSTAGIVALLAIRADSSLSKEIGIDEKSKVLVLGTEGATDLEFYRSVVG